jgi:hypothetical protein
LVAEVQALLVALRPLVALLQLLGRSLRRAEGVEAGAQQQLSLLDYLEAPVVALLTSAQRLLATELQAKETVAALVAVLVVAAAVAVQEPLGFPAPPWLEMVGQALHQTFQALAPLTLAAAAEGIPVELAERVVEVIQILPV